MLNILNDDECWEIMQRRDNRFDGVFYVGVRTTHIYCRPSCVARPLRKNVDFYTSTAAAHAAGLRPCKRCHPDSISPEIRAIHTVCRFLERMPSAPDLAKLAAYVGYSSFHLLRLCKSHLGVTPKQYASMIRRHRLRHVMQQSRHVGDAAYDTGFGSLGALYADAPLGMPPRLYRQGARGLVLQLTCLPSPFGILVVVTSQRGLCFVGFADTDAQAHALAHAEFPAADLQIAPQPNSIALQVESLLHSHPNHVDIPLDIKATAFQQRVWQALRTIPPGETRTYAEIASAIVQPRAIRAVANACAQNPIAIVVPCHRVVHRNPNRSGYRWSAERKRAILAYEQKEPHTGGDS